jgi:Mrp family chromosome partitioning ATPase
MNRNTQNIVKNLDFSLRTHKSKSIVVVSDSDKEGKSTFLRECLPALCELYNRKILLLDCQPERKDVLELAMATKMPGLDYVHAEDLNSLLDYINDCSHRYDTVFINTKTLKRAEKTILPELPIDGAVIVRSHKSIGKKIKPLTNELRDRDIPILGLIMNGGI